ncbi:MAG: Histidine kinase [Mycobacterium sp.]|nr:Histidine kinase [Mycobacterium sp.]
MPTGLGALPARYHRAFNGRDFDTWRDVFDDHVELLMDGTAVQGVDAAVAYGVRSASEFPGRYIVSERVVAEADDTVVTEIRLVCGDPAGGHSRAAGTACEIWRVREGRIVSCRSYSMPEPADGTAAGAATATPDARAELRSFAEEQAALRRVATLVAQAAPPAEVFAAVAAEVGRLLGVDFTILSRYESGGAQVSVGAWSDTGDVVPFPVGTRVQLGGRNVVSLVIQTGRPARIDDYADATGSVADAARGWGLRSAIGAPISVEGRLWGVISVASGQERRLPADTEVRLAGFTELVATAIANAQARMELRGFAEEQAALRRVAALVARVAPPEEVFAAVAAEVGRVLSADVTGISRYDPDGSAAAVGGWTCTGEPAVFPVGTRVRLGGRNVVSLVFETGRPARIDNGTDGSGQPAAFARPRGFGSVAGVPIGVEGRLWGVVMVISTSEQPLPADTVARLAGFTELVGTAISNAEAQAALSASRARIVAAADTARRRIEQDLHDGAQQRLVSLALEVRAAQTVPPEASELAAQLEGVADGLTGVLEELREIAHGIHPAILAEGGLRPALKALARRCAVPVRLEVGVDGRLPEPIEIAAYYVVCEALTNAVKHARATVIDVQVVADAGVLSVGVCDDGCGGADPTNGSGLVGLADRVEALGGRKTLHSPPGAGTSMTATLPLIAPFGPGVPLQGTADRAAESAASHHTRTTGPAPHDDRGGGPGPGGSASPHEF